MASGAVCRAEVRRGDVPQVEGWRNSGPPPRVVLAADVPAQVPGGVASLQQPSEVGCPSGWRSQPTHGRCGKQPENAKSPAGGAGLANV